MTSIPTNTESDQTPKSLIRTSRFGEIEINTEKIISLTSPFLGFANEKRFVLVPHSDESAFWWLQAVDNPNLAFVVLQPAIITPQYNPPIPHSVCVELQASSPAEIGLLLIITIPQGNPQKMTANLLGPVALNAAKCLAKQILLDPTLYSPCWPILQEND
nr:flagellar assembly protein FliW [Desulfobulbaceae bacterium]